nr:uncharacterized protein LOC127308741 [Lolium perenne]
MSIQSPCYTSPAAAPPLECDDLLSEILLRLPPQPSSLPLASLVCRRWRSIASDAGFSRRFRRHHRRNAPPLLGIFRQGTDYIAFQSTMEPPNCIPPGRSSMRAAGRPLLLPRMPPWPRANIPEDAASGPGLGPGRRRPAQLSRAPGD